ncbi:MAG TPA: UbiA family prenyltransferase, partial [Chloroflexia bacterium]|nr:UbiA family prenyltransferase [Chloroflexia bacterium]
LLHFGPSVFTTLAFGVYIVLVARGVPPAGPLLLLLSAQFATQFAISLWNDYWDLPEDRIAKPDKPIPAGVISAARVRMLGWIAVGVAFVLAAPLGPLVVTCTAVGLGAGLLYDVRLKRTPWSPLPFALGFGVLPLWAAAGVGRAWDATVWTAAALTAWLVVALHLADTLPDLDADRAAGLRGLAHILGHRATLAVCWTALGSGLVAALLLGWLMRADGAILAGTVVVGGGLLLAAILLYRQRGVPALRPMAGMIEAAALLTALGWLAAASLR